MPKTYIANSELSVRKWLRNSLGKLDSIWPFLVPRKLSSREAKRIWKVFSILDWDKIFYLLVMIRIATIMKVQLSFPALNLLAFHIFQLKTFIWNCVQSIFRKLIWTLKILVQRGKTIILVSPICFLPFKKYFFSLRCYWLARVRVA